MYTRHIINGKGLWNYTVCSFINFLKKKQEKQKIRDTADFIKKGTFSVHSFNDDYLSIPERPGS